MSLKNFCGACPRKLNKLPSDPCPLALEKISVGSEKTPQKGCPWGINSSEHSYCFWNLYKDLQGNPVSDREICNLEGITNAQLQEDLKSALSKLSKLKDTEIMDDFVSSIKENLENQEEDNSVYLPDNFRTKGDVSDLLEQNSEDMEKKEKLPKKKIPKGFGMPMHKSGERVDLYGTYSQRTLDRIKSEKKAENEKKNKNK